ncbi:hypothetical protein Q1695_004107 [Nippostrongylus brasiliensis]|nr:hypothetical protein Q1695_004107 [Nippostrongylus brasiliensis]
MSDESKGLFLELETEFALSMLRRVPADESAVVSPLSVIFALAMVEAGAKGTTKSQINDLLAKGLADDAIQKHYAALLDEIRNATEGTKTNIANGFFLNQPFHIEDDYAQTVSKKYAAEVRSLDFSQADDAAQVINGFISNATEGKIGDMLSADSVKSLHSIIVNAIYFRAEWLAKFDKGCNSNGPFYSSEGNQREIEFMNEREEFRMYREDDEVQVLSLQYKDTSYAFNIILPKARFGLAEYKSKLTAKKIQELLHSLTESYMTYSIPKMKIETDFKLKEALISMGVSDMFNDEADLTGISKAPPLKVSDASHRAIIEVDEDGTTAAAATLMKMVPMSAIRDEPKIFVADHPFLFVLTKDRSPLFIGQFL